MTKRRMAAAAIFTMGLGFGAASAAPYLQPGMQTMIQQGGVEGTVLGDIVHLHVVYVPIFVPVVHGPRRTTRLLTPAHRAHRGAQYRTAR